VNETYEIDDEDRIKYTIVSVSVNKIEYKMIKDSLTSLLSNLEQVFSDTRKNFLKNFKQFPYIDITPEEVIAKMDQTVIQPDYPYLDKSHKESLFAIQAILESNEGKPLYFIGLDNGKHFKIVSILFKDLAFIAQHYSDGSLTVNINSLNESYLDTIEQNKLHLKHRRPMWFKPYKITTREKFENGKWIPSTEIFVDWNSPEGDHIDKNSLILKIWDWEISLGVYKLYRILPIK
jgi:hypothetical protein